MMNLEKRRIMKYISRKLMNLSQIFEEPRILYTMIKRIPPSYVRDLFIIKKLTKITPKTIIDVGAHFGETSKAMNYVFPKAKIYSFEPVKSSYEKLKKETKNIPNITTYNMALGNANRKCNFWLNEFNAASSLLESKEERAKIFEVTKKKKKIVVEMRRLDCMKEIKIERPLYLKIDVEGAEKLVMEGLGNLIKKVDVLQLEFNFKKLYKNQTELKDIIRYVQMAGLSSFIQINQHISEDNGIIYCDIIFFRRKE